MAHSLGSQFDDLLSSGGEIEGLFQQKRRLGSMHSSYPFLNESVRFSSPIDTDFQDPRENLEQQIADYNKRTSPEYHLRLNEDQVYSGLLRFHHQAGQELLSEDVHVRATTTTSELLPELVTRFQTNLTPPSPGKKVQSHSCITLVQGEMERELDVDEKPLQIALDCSIKGLASPKFFLRTSISKQKGGRKTQHRTNKFTSYVGSLLSKSYGSLPDAGSLEVLTVAASRPSTREKRSSKVLEGDQASVDSFSSGKSSSSGKSGKAALKSSTTPSSKPKKISLSHTLSNQETSSLSSYLQSPGASPLGSPRKVSRPKSVMSKFITRSLRIGKRPKDAQAPSEDIFPQEEEEQKVTTVVSTLVSPLPVERRFTMSVVIQIYFTDARKAQLYKSVLVSEKSTTREVIMQALERYNMNLSDPKDFGLFEVIGKWQDVTQTLQGYKLSQPDGRVVSGSATAPPGAYSPLSSRQRVTAVEEFIVCYARELNSRESPYSAQFYLTTQEGYTRRFELRPKLKSKPLPIPAHVSNSSSYERHRTTSLPDSIPVLQLPDSPLGIFGDTAHRRRKSRRRNQMFEQQNQPEETPGTPTILQPSAVAPTPDRESNETGGEELTKGSEVQGDAGPQEIPISLHPAHPVDFSTLRCGSPDSGVIFSKEQANSTKSSISSEQDNITIPQSGSLYPAGGINEAFLLSLKLCCPEKEFLVHKLLSSATIVTSPAAVAVQSTAETTSEMLDDEGIILHAPEYADHSQPFCRIHRCPKNQPITSDAESPTGPQPCFEYDLQVSNDTVPVTVNGVKVQRSSVLCHGDLLAIGRNYLFLFQDYSSVSGDILRSYHWAPHPLEDRGRDQRTPSFTTEMTSTILEGEEERSAGLVQPEHENGEGRKEAVSKNTSAPVSRESSIQSPTRTPTDLSEVRQAYEGDETAPKILPVIALNGTQMSSPELAHTRNFSMDSNFEVSDVFEPEKFETSTPHKPATSSPHGVQQTGRIRSQSSPPSSALPRDRKLMFSFNVTEEDTLLRHLLSKQDFVTASSPSSCKLAPAYILAMCVEYSLRCNGPVAAGRFVRKASKRIQEVIWECTKKVKEWQPDPLLAKKPLSMLPELFSRLQPAFFWLANSLEFYNFLTKSCDPLDFSAIPTREGEGPAEEDPVTTLYNILVYTFQQAFYPVSKVLYHSLPVMLESCSEEKVCSGEGESEGVGERSIVIDQAVEFLQALLDLLTELQLHLGVISQFYSNLFFFVNTAMFNALVNQGPNLGLFQFTSGSALRANLNLLEGWACQVGFKDVILHYLAKFSSVVDLLATPADELLQMDWQRLCSEFPVLHPAQLHFILSHYLLPASSQLVPTHWTPSQEDALHALNTNAVQESFESHPGFCLPSTGYTVDLSRPPPQAEQFQLHVEILMKSLKKAKRSVDIVPVVESRPCASIPTLITEVAPAGNSTPPIRRKVSETESLPSHDRSSFTDSPLHNSRDIGSNTESQEDLLEDTRNQRNRREKVNYLELRKETVVNILDSYGDENAKEKTTLLVSNIDGGDQSGQKERVERVRSMVAPRSYATPEKLILEAEEVNGVEPVNEWMAKHFPAGSSMVTVPRGDKGFGIVMVEGKDPETGDSVIFVQRVLPGTTAAQCKMLVTGDRILAIDGQMLDGADYLIAQKYLKEAEDDVSLVIAPRNLTYHTH